MSGDSDRRKDRVAIVSSMLLILIGLSTFMIVMGSAANPATRPRRDLAFLRDVYSTLRDTMNSEIMNVATTVTSVGHYVTPYDKARFPGEFPIVIEGPAAQSATVRGLLGDLQPSLEWLLVELRFYCDSLTGGVFENMKIVEVRRLIHLGRLTEAEGIALDECISNTWSKYDLPVSSRGDPNSLAKWAKSATGNPRLSSLRALSDAEINEMFDRIIAAGQLDVDGNDGKDKDATVASVLASLARTDAASEESVELSVPLLGFKIPGAHVRYIYPILATMLSTMTLSLWHQLEARRRPSLGFSLTALLSIEGTYRILNVCFLVLAAGLVLFALGLTSVRAGQYQQWVALGLNAAGALFLIVEWLRWVHRMRRPASPVPNAPVSAT